MSNNLIPMTSYYDSPSLYCKVFPNASVILCAGGDKVAVLIAAILLYYSF